MVIRFILVLLIFSTACQSGWIPCPEAKSIRFKKSNARPTFRESYATASANAREELHNKGSRTSDRRKVDNIAVEDWDCPHPGQKKYMPKNVKDNIRRNMKKIKSSAQPASDSITIKH